MNNQKLYVTNLKSLLIQLMITIVVFVFVSFSILWCCEYYWIRVICISQEVLKVRKKGPSCPGRYVVGTTV